MGSDSIYGLSSDLRLHTTFVLLGASISIHLQIEGAHHHAPLAYQLLREPSAKRIDDAIRSPKLPVKSVHDAAKALFLSHPHACAAGSVGHRTCVSIPCRLRFGPGW